MKRRSLRERVLQRVSAPTRESLASRLAMVELVNAIHAGITLAWALRYDADGGARLQRSWETCSNDEVMRDVLQALCLMDYRYTMKCDFDCRLEPCRQCAVALRESHPKMTVAMVVEATRS